MNTPVEAELLTEANKIEKDRTFPFVFTPIHSPQRHNISKHAQQFLPPSFLNLFSQSDSVHLWTDSVDHYRTQI